MDQERLRHLRRVDAADQRMSHLMRLLGRYVVHPSVIRCRWTIVVVEQSRSIFSKGGFSSTQRIHSLRQGKRSSLFRRRVIKGNGGLAVDISCPGDQFPVRRKSACIDLPFVLREPVDFLAGDIE